MKRGHFELEIFDTCLLQNGLKISHLQLLDFLYHFSALNYFMTLFFSDGQTNVVNVIKNICLTVLSN